MQRHLVVYHSQILPLEHTAGTCSTVRRRVPDYYIRNNTSCRLKRARSFLMMPGRRLNPKPCGASLLEKQSCARKKQSCAFWCSVRLSLGTGAYQPCLKPGDAWFDILCMVASIVWSCLEAAGAVVGFRISCDDLGVNKVQGGV